MYRGQSCPPISDLQDVSTLSYPLHVCSIAGQYNLFRLTEHLMWLAGDLMFDYQIDSRRQSFIFMLILRQLFLCVQRAGYYC